MGTGARGAGDQDIGLYLRRGCVGEVCRSAWLAPDRAFSFAFAAFALFALFFDSAKKGFDCKYFGFNVNVPVCRQNHTSIV